MESDIFDTSQDAILMPLNQNYGNMEVAQDAFQSIIV